ncbi:MAG: winged helix-turn-helix domain-containing protein [Clostridiaceae bacterium]
MKNAIENYLKESIDENIIIGPWNGKKNLPLFLLEAYNFYQAEILGKKCIFIEILYEAPGIDILKKHMKAVNKIADQHLVLLYKSITWFRRKSLIKNRIPFIVEDGQMYLPFMGLDLKRTLDEPKKKIDKFSSSTQLGFLYFLYNKEMIINATALAEALNTSNMTASRILNDLYAVGLLTYEVAGRTGRSKEYKRISDPDYYREGSRYLKSPVKQIIYVENEVDDTLIAGLEALSMISMINPPQGLVRAITKEKLDKESVLIVRNKDRITDEKLVELEVWHYDPTLLSKEQYVDIASLALSLKDINDERVEQALAERLESEEWYTE